MMNSDSISLLRLSAGYLLLLIPLGIMLWFRIELLGRASLAVVRMTAQLLFVGFYLQVVFKVNNVWLTMAWLMVMISVADISIIRNCELKLSRFAIRLFIALLAGTAVPLFYFMGVILTTPTLLEARYAIPIGGMILGNCLRADVIGVSGFYQSIRKNERSFLLSLSQGATISEAVLPHFREAFTIALLPTVTTMSTIGLVSLPGMMTGVILGGSDPMMAIKYQIAIMIAIFTGTSITIVLAVFLTVKKCFSGYGILDKEIFVGK